MSTERRRPRIARQRAVLLLLVAERRPRRGWGYGDIAVELGIRLPDVHATIKALIKQDLLHSQSRDVLNSAEARVWATAKGIAMVELLISDPDAALVEARAVLEASPTS